MGAKANSAKRAPTDAITGAKEEIMLTGIRIGPRLGLGFGILLLLLVAVSAMGLVRLVDLQSRMKEIVEINNQELKLAVEMRDSVRVVALGVRNIALLTDEGQMREQVERIRKAREKYTASYEKLGSLFKLPQTTEEEKKLFALLKPAREATAPLVDRAIELGLENKNQEATVVLLKEVRPVQNKWLDDLSSLVEMEEKLNVGAYEEAKAAYASGRAWMVGLAVLAILLGMLLAVLISRSITRPLAAAVDLAGSVARGDLSGRIEVRGQDEVAELMGALKTMNEGLRELIRGVLDESAKVSDASTELNQAARQVAESSAQQSESASSMAAAVEQVTVSIDQVAQNAREAHRISTQSDELSNKGGEVIHDTIGEMGRIADSVNQSAEVIRQLETQSDQISGVVQVIREVAEQTNLLALNAAIEAARAGEQGRGFAVVADEVRKLAERTAASTQEIGQMIAAIQSGTRNAVATMEAGAARAKEGVALADRARESIGQIREGAQRVVSTVGDITDALKEQSAASNELAKSVEQIAQMAERNSAAIGQTAGTAQELKGRAEGLRATVSRFRL